MLKECLGNHGKPESPLFFFFYIDCKSRVKEANKLWKKVQGGKRKKKRRKKNTKPKHTMSPNMNNTLFFVFLFCLCINNGLGVYHVTVEPPCELASPSFEGLKKLVSF